MDWDEGSSKLLVKICGAPFAYSVDFTNKKLSEPVPSQFKVKKFHRQGSHLYYRDKLLSEFPERILPGDRLKFNEKIICHLNSSSDLMTTYNHAGKALHRWSIRNKLIRLDGEILVFQRAIHWGSNVFFDESKTYPSLNLKVQRSGKFLYFFNLQSHSRMALLQASESFTKFKIVPLTGNNFYVIGRLSDKRTLYASTLGVKRMPVLSCQLWKKIISYIPDMKALSLACHKLRNIIQVAPSQYPFIESLKLTATRPVRYKNSYPLGNTRCLAERGLSVILEGENILKICDLATGCLLKLIVLKETARFELYLTKENKACISINYSGSRDNYLA